MIHRLIVYELRFTALICAESSVIADEPWWRTSRFRSWRLERCLGLDWYLSLMWHLGLSRCLWLRSVVIEKIVDVVRIFTIVLLTIDLAFDEWGSGLLVLLRLHQLE